MEKEFKNKKELLLYNLIINQKRLKFN